MNRPIEFLQLVLVVVSGFVLVVGLTIIILHAIVQSRMRRMQNESDRLHESYRRQQQTERERRRQQNENDRRRQQNENDRRRQQNENDRQRQRQSDNQQDNLPVLRYDPTLPDRAESLRIMGLSANPTASQIKKAYRTKSLATHPNRGGDHTLFTRLGQAYDVLKNQ